MSVVYSVQGGVVEDKSFVINIDSAPVAAPSSRIPRPPVGNILSLLSTKYFAITIAPGHTLLAFAISANESIVVNLLGS